jgi:cell division septal protein FtsQ
VNRKPGLTRAEIVRQRRTARLSSLQAQQSTRVLHQSSVSAYSTLPPITARSESFSQPAPQTHRRSRRRVRRFQATLSAPNIQIRMPALPNLRYGGRLFTALLVTGLLYAIYILWTSPSFRITQAQLKGNQRITADEINNELSLSGQPILLAVPGQIRRDLQASFPELSSVSVKVGLPNRLTVTVSERQPVISWQQDGSYAWIDAQGIAFRPNGQVEGLITVEASGAPPVLTQDQEQPASLQPFISTEMVKALQTLQSQAPEGTPILYDPQYGLGWKDSRGWQVYFGQSPQDIALKLRVYQALVDQLTKQGEQPSLISVAYPDSPFYRLGQ